MIEYKLDTANSILLVRPTCALNKNDFVELAKAVDPQIAFGDLAGLIINAPAFPGWDSFGAIERRGRHRLAPWGRRRASGIALRVSEDSAFFR